MLAFLLQHEEYYLLNYSERRLYTPMFQYEVPSNLIDCEVVATPLLFRCGVQLFNVAGQRIAESLPFTLGNVQIDATQVQFKCLRKNAYQPYNETHFQVQTRARRCLVDLQCKWHCYEHLERQDVRQKLTKLEALDAGNKLVQLQLEYRTKVEALMEREARLGECGRRLEDASATVSEQNALTANTSARLEAVGEKLQQCMQQQQNTSAFLLACNQQLAQTANLAAALEKAGEENAAKITALNSKLQRQQELNDRIKREQAQIAQTRASDQDASRQVEQETQERSEIESQPILAETKSPATELSATAALSGILQKASRITLATGLAALFGYHWLLLLKGAGINP